MAESFEYIRYIGFCKTAAQPILNIFRSGNFELCVTRCQFDLRSRYERADYSPRGNFCHTQSRQWHYWFWDTAYDLCWPLLSYMIYSSNISLHYPIRKVLGWMHKLFLIWGKCMNLDKDECTFGVTCFLFQRLNSAKLSRIWISNIFPWISNININIILDTSHFLHEPDNLLVLKYL